MSFIRVTSAFFRLYYNPQEPFDRAVQTRHDYGGYPAHDGGNKKIKQRTMWLISRMDDDNIGGNKNGRKNQTQN